MLLLRNYSQDYLQTNRSLIFPLVRGFTVAPACYNGFINLEKETLLLIYVTYKCSRESWLGTTWREPVNVKISETNQS